jgi:SAM-dependent methyltransferase
MSEYSHRKKKREIEMNLILNCLKGYFYDKDKKVLEFGCGDGFQISFLKQISNNVKAIDIELDVNLIKRYPNTILQSSINDTSFEDDQFDLIFSNHVIEHLEDLHGATKEMLRIGSEDCLYVFSVPTSLWLLLSVPAQYYRKLKYIFSMFNKKNVNGTDKLDIYSSSTRNSSFWNIIFPKGHGVYTGFFECYNAFRIKSWNKLFNMFGFNVVDTRPLLLYSASEFPVVPTTQIFTKLGVCSSVLFILKKN